MTDRQKKWRLLSESFDRELSDDEQNVLGYFRSENESPREFEELFKRIRDNSGDKEPLLEADSSLYQRLSNRKKDEIQRLLESEIEKQRVPLSNRDVVYACELVTYGAMDQQELTEKITKWNPDSISLSVFLKDAASDPDIDFSKIESHISETVFSQTLDQTLLDEVVTAIKQRVPAEDYTVFENTSSQNSSAEFVKLLNKATTGEGTAFEQLLDRLTIESRSVILQTRMFSRALRLKPVVEEVTLRLVGRNKLDRAQMACYYRSVGSAIRILFDSDPELVDSLLPSIGKQRISVKQMIASLNQLAHEEPRFVQMFNLRFFAGLTTQQVAGLLNLTEQKVSVECGYGSAQLLQLIGE